LDAIGSGAGFTLALLAIASIREILGSGTWFGFELPWLADNNIMIFSLAPGGFIVFACLLALVNKMSKSRKVRREHDCTSCPSAFACGKRDERRG
jgi:electron transport complex protein RnfE